MKKKMIMTIVAFTVLLLPGFIHGAIPASERAALSALYISANGDDWADRNGWKTPPLHTDGFAMPGTEGSWNGITVTADHVTKIEMISHKLIGHIPAELGDLSHLEEISLGNSIDYIEEIWNHLSGSIPPALGILSNLKRLDLNYNQLSGSIPAELGNLGNLEYLNLQNNQLSGGIPTQLGNLSNILSLGLSMNKLGGTIPSSFLNFTRISSLFLYHNCLSAADPALIAWLDSHDPYWSEDQDQCDIPGIALNRTTLNFGAYNPGIDISPQTVLIGNNGTGTLNWNASGAALWLSFTPSSGTGDSVLSVSVDPTGLAVGDYTGEIIITDSRASNSPRSISVSLRIYNQGQTSAPFGDFATPLDGAAVSGSAPVFDPYSPVFDSYSRSLTLDEIKIVEIKELERVEINLSDDGVSEGYLVVGDQLRELPIGSTLDRERGIFYWQPGPGFIGEYLFVFVGKDAQGKSIRQNIVVNIKPKE